MPTMPPLPRTNVQSSDGTEYRDVAIITANNKATVSKDGAALGVLGPLSRVVRNGARQWVLTADSGEVWTVRAVKGCNCQGGA